MCNFIPRELVDVAILEEPEHLNWFRMPNSNEKSKRALIGIDAGEEDGSSEQSDNNVGSEQKTDVAIDEATSRDIAVIEEEPVCSPPPPNDDDNPRREQGKGDDDGIVASRTSSGEEKCVEKAKLGWTHRFRFVVGVVHTNYEEYARQYGIGASLIAAPAIGAMSALAMRAHCHQVIKLSDTLPSFAPGKEVTCNVHGVRGEFLEGVDSSALRPSSGERHEGRGDKNEKDGDGDSEAPSPVYFIGKLVWAKGFDLMLELQDIFRKRNGGYFHIDVYGGGPDEKAIARAFHGRNHTSLTERPAPPPLSKDKDAITDAPSDFNAAAVFSNGSIKDQSSNVIEHMKQKRRPSSGADDVVAQYLSLGFEVSEMNGSATYVKESRSGLSEEEDKGLERSNSKNALDILGDLSIKSIDTGVKTSQAVYNIADSSIKNILTMSFSQLKRPLKHLKNKGKAAEQGGEQTKAADGDGTEGDKPQPHFVFDPPASRFEWRRHPIPAKFPGVIDHAQLKNVGHKIFLNPSTSEVGS